MVEPTKEQKKIVDFTPDPWVPLVVKAFAGTGKTFTLQMYANARPGDRILYSAFNKAIQLDAERKMPGNVTCRTNHSLAYRAFGVDYQKAGQLWGNIPVWRVAKELGTKNIVVANFALSIVRKFLSSADREIFDVHIPDEVLNYYENDGSVMPDLVGMADDIWYSMKKLSPNSLPMVHDGYLKLYQLSGPELDFDYIMLDEAQDTTPCVWDIMINQSARKVIVGDEHQSIYGWRGSIDALDLAEETEQHYLTQSFRFGPKIAALASTLLRRYKGEKMELKGLDALDTEISVENPSEKRTIVSRGNASIFYDVAWECWNTKNDFGFVGGDHSDYRFQVYADVFNMYARNHESIKDPVINSFNDYEALKDYGKKIKSVELVGACIMVEEYKERIPEILRRVRNRDVGEKYADLCYVTGHKSKGLEFPVVHISNDFSKAIDYHKNDSETGIVPEDEINLLYVSITRATSKLYIPVDIKEWIEKGSNKPEVRPSSNIVRPDPKKKRSFSIFSPAELARGLIKRKF